MANTSFQKLQDLNLSRDEVARLGEALKKDEFRQLLSDYVAEIQDPANKKLYESEITQLEKERGNDITFIHPEPGYVIKTSCDGTAKCFVNVCTSARIQPPTSTIARQGAARGLSWALPHSLSPPRDDLDARGARCHVYDVVFHPDTLHLAGKNDAFRDMLTKTACEAVEAAFDVALDTSNLKYPKMGYKGLAHASVIRKPAEDYKAEPREPLEQRFLDSLYAQADNSAAKKPKKSARKDKERSAYATPTYLIKHRSHVDIQEFREDKTAKLNAAIPRELIIEINLPLLKSSSDIVLDVTEKTVQLVSEKPSKYKLSLTLPYRVNQDNGNAKFDKDQRKLVVVLPVKRALVEYHREDSGVESDPIEEISTSPAEEAPEISDFCCRSSGDERTRFLDDEVSYALPEFTSHLYENVVAFTLNVKNVEQASIAQRIDDTSMHIKFASVSAGYYQVHYAFLVKLPVASIESGRVSIESWDNNVVVQIPFNCDKPVEYYHFGVEEANLKKAFLEEPAILNSVLAEPIPEEAELEIVSKREALEEDRCIFGTSYESSGDELSCSPSKGKGILKRLAIRRAIGRSISESDLDDVCSSVDSAVPEDVGEMSASLKKTVRFNDVITKQLFRSNSSILGQKKKNQRKAKNKKKAQERRASESEASGGEDKGEEEAHDIFDMDINC